jgi:hypothetical protein
MSPGPAAWLPSALGSLVGQLLGNRDCVFKFDGDVCAVNQQVVNLLQGQLDRCGPQQLSCPACGPCPPQECPPAPSLTGQGVALGVIIGALLAIVLERLRATRVAADEPRKVGDVFANDARKVGDFLVSTPLTRQRALQ